MLMTLPFFIHNTRTDIDECAEGTDGCVHTCTDTKGSYECSCDTGYRLANDSHGCDGGLPKIYQGKT